MWYKKILIANRGEIAVRVLRTCRELGIPTVVLYHASDYGSLHVRLGDECVPLETPAGFMDQQAILEIAKSYGVDAIHPGYGFLAEEASFIRACQEAGITFIGPPAEVVEAVRSKIQALNRVQAAGFRTVEHSGQQYGSELKALSAEADQLGYPLMVKSCRGGRGRGARLVRSPEALPEAVRQAKAEAQAVYGDGSVYLQKTFPNSHQVGVQILGDRYGNLIHLGEREGSLMKGNQKMIEESPAPSLDPEQRARLHQMALSIARLFRYENVGTVEFLVDENGQFYFTEFKARIQVEHPLAEMVSRIDLVREQIRLAAGERLVYDQSQVRLDGWAMQSRISAEDPWKDFMPSPGTVRRARLPGGAEVRVDTYIYTGCHIPAEYDSLIAKVITWGQDRTACLQRMRGALEEFKLFGTHTNLPLIQSILMDSELFRGSYNLEFKAWLEPSAQDNLDHLRDLAVAVALLYVQRQESPSYQPGRLISGWHRNSRRLPD